jgi:hypothetical protein
MTLQFQLHSAFQPVDSATAIKFSANGCLTANGDLRTVQYQQYPAPVITTCTSHLSEFIKSYHFKIDKYQK